MEVSKEYTYTNATTGKSTVIKRTWTNKSNRGGKIDAFNKFLEEQREWIEKEKPSSKKVSDKYNENLADDMKMSRSMIYTYYSKFCDENNLPRRTRTRKTKRALTPDEINEVLDSKDEI